MSRRGEEAEDFRGADGGRRQRRPEVAARAGGVTEEAAAVAAAVVSERSGGPLPPQRGVVVFERELQAAELLVHLAEAHERGGVGE